MKRVLIAGGLCGTTMLIASQKVQELCDKQDIDVLVTVHNLWEGAAITGREFDVVVEMFPYFEGLGCPLLCGKPFINHIGEKELLAQIVEYLRAG